MTEPQFDGISLITAFVMGICIGAVCAAWFIRD